MSARRKDDLPLKGIRVLVGRARHQAGSLSRELRKNGAKVIEVPFIEIRKPRSFRQLDSALRNLESYDWLILTSVNGVEAMWSAWQNSASHLNSIGKSTPVAPLGATNKPSGFASRL